MENLILKVKCGSNFQNSAKKAQKKATLIRNCEFNFNGIKCIVDKHTDLDNLWIHYLDAHCMEWESVGPICEEYSKDIKEKIEEVRDTAKKRIKEENEKYETKEKIKKTQLRQAITGLVIELKDNDFWNKQKEVNIDDYGKAVLEYAENWALLMQYKILNGEKVKDIAEKTSFEADTVGISGFMYGISVRVLSKCWKHGEELMEWHNEKYNHKGNAFLIETNLDKTFSKIIW